MATAAGRFLAALDKEQAAKATFAFDAPERLNWHFIPRPRKGLPIKEMTPAQRALAFGLVHTGVAGLGLPQGDDDHEPGADPQGLEQGKRRRSATPSSTSSRSSARHPTSGKWGWRVEGHHLSLNFTLDDGKIVAATPAFFGANPGRGPPGTARRGCGPWPTSRTARCGSLQALDAEQKKRPSSPTRPPRTSAPPTRPSRRPTTAVGIAFAELNDEQKQMLRALVEAYAADMPAEVAGAWLEEIKEAGPEDIRFAWFGPADRIEPHAYRVQGPTFLIEFNNTQNGANHIHSVWRNMLGDFGIPLKKS